MRFAPGGQEGTKELAEWSFPCQRWYVIVQVIRFTVRAGWAAATIRPALTREKWGITHTITSWLPCSIDSLYSSLNSSRLKPGLGRGKRDEEPSEKTVKTRSSSVAASAISSILWAPATESSSGNG